MKINNNYSITFTKSELENLVNSLEYTTDHGIRMGMCGGITNGVYLSNKKAIKQLNDLLSKM